LFRARLAQNKFCCSARFSVSPPPALESNCETDYHAHWPGRAGQHYTGTAVFCPAAADVLRVELGYDCDQFAPDESEEQAKELMARFRQYAERHGVHLKNDQ